MNGSTTGKNNDQTAQQVPQQQNSSLIQTNQPQQVVVQQRQLINPQTYQQHQKQFTIDKQEYQSVFRIIDKDNTGQITIEQVNNYLEKFEQLHQQQLFKKQQEQNQSQLKQSNTTKSTAQQGYQRTRISNGPTPIKTQKQTSFPGTTQQQVVGSHLISSNNTEPLSATAITSQKSVERTTGNQRRVNQPPQIDQKHIVKTTTGTNSNPSQVQQNQQYNQAQTSANQTSKNASGSFVQIQNKNLATSSQQKASTQNGVVTQNNNSYGQSQTVANTGKVQTERVQKLNELQGAISNLTTASTTNKQIQPYNGLQNSKTSFKQQNSESPGKRPSQAGIDPQQQNPDNVGSGSNLQLKLVQINSPGVRTNNSRTSSANESQNQAQNPQQIVDTSNQVTKFSNGKQTLEFEEFIEVIRESCTDPEGAENYLIHAFSMFDIEKKGYINSQDLKLVFELLGENVTDEELATTITKIIKMSQELRDLFNIEVDEFQKKAKSEEEIQKMCTKDDMTELQRATFLLKKGYEIQKISVINNLDRYLKELGANEELLSLIISSLEDWDDKMQIECAKSFIEPLKQKLLSKDNRQRILKLSVDIITKSSNENEDLRQNWINVFDHVVGQVEFQYVLIVAFKAIQELTDRKSTFTMRKLGNRLLTSLAKSCGEEGFDADVKVLKQVVALFSDTNYKIRMDGAVFLKEYLQINHEKLLGSTRLTQTFIPEICELLNDEETYIKIEAIEAISYVLETLDQELIERELMPNLLKMLVFEDNHDSIIQRMAQLIGKVAFKLQKTQLHLKYRDQLMNFFKGICSHKTEEGRLSAAYNIPCFHQLFGRKEVLRLAKEQQIEEESKDDEIEQFGSTQFDFTNAYYQFANDTNTQIRILTASCLHEAYKIQSENENTQFLRDALHDLLEDECTDVLVTLLINLDIIIDKYANQHAIQSYNPVDYPDLEVKPIQPPKLLQLRPKDDKKKDDSIQKPQNMKKLRTSTQNVQDHTEDEQNYLNSPVFLPEFPSEQLYSLLLGRLINLKCVLKEKIALWRECVLLWDKLSLTIQKFNLPEFQDRLIGYLFEDIQKGNQQLRQACCRVLVQILSNQQDSSRRQLLAQFLKTELGDSTSFQMRKTFIIFCRESVGHLRQQFFIDYFYTTYLKMSTDRVSNVRLEYILSLVVVKPYIDSKQQINQELSDSIFLLRKDLNKEVAEATENAEYELLKQRKKVEQVLLQMEKDCVARQKALDLREIRDTEEKKKRMEEEEENRYDYGTYGQTNRVGMSKQKTKLLTKGTVVQVTKTGSSKKVISAVIPSTTDKTPTKRKPATGTQKRMSSAMAETKDQYAVTTSNTSRKTSILLPQTASRDLDKPSNTLTIPSQSKTSQELQNGADNYKRSQQLVQTSGTASNTNHSYKRSQSLLESSKQKIVKKEGATTQLGVTGLSKRKTGALGTLQKGITQTNGLSSDSSDLSSNDDATPTSKTKNATGSTTTAGASSKNKHF